MQAGLLQREGAIGEVLTEVEAFDSCRLALLSVGREVLRDAYMQSVSWADDTFSITRSLRKA